MRIATGFAVALLLFASIIRGQPINSGGLTTATFASPPSSPKVNQAYLFTDASAAGTCSGGGTAYAICVWDGATFVASSGTSTGLGDPGANSIPYRNGAGTTIPGTATQISGTSYCADAGSTDAYACNLTPAIASYVAGTVYWFKANTANTGAATININAKGALTIKKSAGGVTTDLVDNDIRVGQVVACMYDGSNCQMATPVGNVLPANTTATSNQFFTAYNSGTGAFTKAQPAFTDVSGTVGAAQLPNPGASSKGGVQSQDCTGTGHVLSINTDGTVTCSADTGGGSTVAAGTGVTVVTAGGTSTVGIDSAYTQTNLNDQLDEVRKCGGSNSGTVVTCGLNPVLSQYTKTWVIAGELTSVAVSSNVGTATTTVNHGLVVGRRVIITGATTDADLNATYTIATVPTTTTFTFTTANVANGTYTDSGMTVRAATGMRMLFMPIANCTGTPTTINVDTLGAKKYFASNGTTNGACTAGVPVDMIYDSTLDSGTGGFRQLAGGSSSSSTKRVLLQGQGAGCSGGVVAVSGWSTGASAAPTAACEADGFSGYLGFTAGSAQNIYGRFELPSDWVGTLTLIATAWSSAANNPTAFAVTHYCVSTGATSGGTYANSQAVAITVAAASGRSVSTPLALDTTGCAAGNEYYMKIAITANTTNLNLLRASVTE